MERKQSCIYYYVCSIWSDRECRNCGLFKEKEKKHETTNEVQGHEEVLLHE